MSSIDEQATVEPEDVEEFLPCPQHKWRNALLVGLLLAIVATIAIWALFEPEYEASAQIRIDGNRPRIAFEPERSMERNEVFVATQLSLLRSSVVLLGASTHLCQPGAKSVIQQLLDGEMSGWSRVEAASGELISTRSLDPMARQAALANWASSRVRVTRAGEGSSIYSVSFRSSDADFSQSFGNALVQTYFDVLKSQRGRQNGDLLKLLRNERDRRRPELARRQADLKRRMADEMMHGTREEIADALSSLATRMSESEIEREKFALELEREALTRIENRIVQLETESAAPSRVELWRLADKPCAPVVKTPYRQWLVAWIVCLGLPLLVIAFHSLYARLRGGESAFAKDEDSEAAPE